MSTKTNPREPAFPRDHRHEGHNGISIRDYFASNADIPWNAVMDTLEKKGGPQPITVSDVITARAVLKYMEADAMLSEREKEAGK